LWRANLTSLAAEAVAEHLGLFDHAQKSYWVALQARLPRQNIIEEPDNKTADKKVNYRNSANIRAGIKLNGLK
jgi:hypothetical protein